MTKLILRESCYNGIPNVEKKLNKQNNNAKEFRKNIENIRNKERDAYYNASDYLSDRKVKAKVLTK